MRKYVFVLGSLGAFVAMIVLMQGGQVQAVDVTDSIGCTMSAQGENANPPDPSFPPEGAAQLVDNNNQTKWLDFAASSWIECQLASSATVLQYSLTSANDYPTRDPQDWQLLGSNDGQNWTVVDSRSGQSFSGRFTTNNYSVATPNAYTYYRLDITSNSGDWITQIAELTLDDSGTTPPPATVPEQVTSLLVTSGDAQLDLQWSAPANGGAAITDYVIEYRTGANPFTVYSDAVSNVTAATITGLVNGTTYDVRVLARNSVGDGAPSTVQSATPQSSVPTPTVPAQVTGVTLTAGDGTLTANWNAPNNGGSTITDYIVEYLPPEGVAQLVDDNTQTKWLDFNATGWVQASLPAGYTVRSYTLTSANDAPERDPVNWQLLGSNDGVNWTTVDTRLSQVFANRFSQNTYTVQSPSSFTSYRLDITSNGSGTLIQLAELELMGDTGSTPPPSPTIPSAPQSLSVSAGDTQVDLVWVAPADDGGAAITDYVVEYTLQGANAYSVFADGVSSQTGATVTGLTNGTTYEFRVRAINSVGQSANSGVVSAMPESTGPVNTVPAQVINVSAVGGNSQVSLSWSVPNNGGAPISDYIIEQRAVGGVFSTVNDGVSSLASATVTGLTNQTTYEYRVRARNSVGDGVWSTIVSATPQAPTPPPTGNWPTYSLGTCPTFAPANRVTLSSLSGGVTRNRQFRFDAPTNVQSAQNIPVVVAWHWLGGNPDDMINWSGLGNALGDGAIVVAPTATGEAQYEWYTGSSDSNNPDLTFFDDILACLDAQYNIDRNRVYIVGHSAGAAWTTYMSMYRADYIAAASMMSGGLQRPEHYVVPAANFPMIMSWGGDTDTYFEPGANFGYNTGDPQNYSFAVATMDFLSRTRADGHFAVECVGNYGHQLPPSNADQYHWPFLRAHSRTNRQAFTSNSQLAPAGIHNSCVISNR